MTTTKETTEADEDAARRLGRRIGYGRMMQLGEQLWREVLAVDGLEGAEHSTGPCVSFLVPCPCRSASRCDWCCGAGRVTKRVAEAMANRTALDQLKAEHNQAVYQLDVARRDRDKAEVERDAALARIAELEGA